MTPKIGVLLPGGLCESLFLPADRRRLESLGEVRWNETDAHLALPEAIAMLHDCQIGVGSWGTLYPSADLLDGCPELRLWEHVAGTVKHMFGPYLDGRSLTIASCKTAIADSVAEMTLGQILLGLRGVFENAAANRRGKASKPRHLRVLFGSTVGVIGASEVGRRVIRLLQPFGCRVLVYDPFLTSEQATALGAEKRDSLLDLCAESDVVTLHTPALPATRHLLGADQFRAMKDEAIFINTSRGLCVDEAALIAELEKGRMFAFLDVSNPEPAAPDSPFRHRENVVYTSHIAGPPSPNLGHQAVDDIAAFLAGRAPLCVVTPDQLDHTA